MSTLGHYFERAGLPTVSISLVRIQTEKVAPPRALWVPFPLGRPLGSAADAGFQREVLIAALSLLERTDGPILEDFERDAPEAEAEGEGALEGWACPVDLGPALDADTPAAQLAAEVALMRPWYEQRRRERGRTTAAASGLSLDAIVDFLSSFFDDPEGTPSPVEGLPLGDALKLAVEDLKAFYFEAATVKPAALPARHLNDWFWYETAAAPFLRALRKKASAHPEGLVQLVAGFGIVPSAQARSKKSD